MMQPTWVLLSVVAALYLTFFLMERFSPLRVATRSLWSRLLVNVIVSALAFAAAAVTVRPAVAQVLGLSPEHEIGLLALFELPVAIEFGIAFLLFDWSFYWWHRANHRVPLLWRFHHVHHVDPDLDVTTAFRFHVGEIGFSAAFRVVQVVLIGPAAWMYFAYELVFQAGTLFHHSNMKLPVGVERVLNWVLVTPRMHGVHHSHYHDETDSNYSTVLSWWDRLHRSVRLNVQQREIEVGVPGYSLPGDNQVWTLLTMPFRRQRPYWQRPDGTVMETRSAPPDTDPPTHMQE